MKKLSIMFFLMSISAFAQEFTPGRILIATLTSNIDSRVTKIFLQTTPSVGITHLIKSRDSIEMVFPIENLEEGIVFEREQGLDIFTFKADQFDTEQGGNLKLKFLSNGLSRNYREVELEIRNTHKGLQFFHEKIPFNKMKAIGNRYLGRIVGIKEFEFSEE